MIYKRLRLPILIPVLAVLISAMSTGVHAAAKRVERIGSARFSERDWNNTTTAVRRMLKDKDVTKNDVKAAVKALDGNGIFQQARDRSDTFDLGGNNLTERQVRVAFAYFRTYLESYLSDKDAGKIIKKFLKGIRRINLAGNDLSKVTKATFKALPGELEKEIEKVYLPRETVITSNTQDTLPKADLIIGGESSRPKLPPRPTKVSPVSTVQDDIERIDAAIGSIEQAATVGDIQNIYDSIINSVTRTDDQQVIDKLDELLREVESRKAAIEQAAAQPTPGDRETQAARDAITAAIQNIEDIDVATAAIDDANRIAEDTKNSINSTLYDVLRDNLTALAKAVADKEKKIQAATKASKKEAVKTAEPGAGKTDLEKAAEEAKKAVGSLNPND